MLLANVLGVHHAYLHCENDRLAEIILATNALPISDQDQMLQSLNERLGHRRASTPKE